MLEFRAPSGADVAELVRRMRPADVAECEAAGHPDLHAVVTKAVAVSPWCRATRVDGQLAAIFGVHPLQGLLGDTGVPWLLGTSTMTEHRRTFVRLAPSYIATMLNAYPKLTNVVHAANTEAVRWLRRVGFSLAAPFPYGPQGEPFRVFTLER